MEFRVRLEAQAWERFAPGAFDAKIGGLSPLHLEGDGPDDVIRTVRLVAAKVEEDGSAVTLTYLIAGGLAERVADEIAAGTIGPMSFRLPPQ
jgi:hypothetical protein